MSSFINTNVKALTAQGSLSAVNNKMSQSMQRLATGLRINSAKDDAAGLAITNKMTADIRGLGVAIRNANDGLSLAQTAEGAMASINGMLQRMRELAVQASNGTSSDLARKSSQLEVEQLKQEINNIAAQTSINGIKLLDGSASKLVLQTGSEIGQTMNIQLESVNTSSLGVGSRPSLSATGVNDSAAITAATGTIGTTANLRTGDLYINGVSVGSSVSSSDTLSFAGKVASSIAKAAAINEVSSQSGVKAVVNETYVAGAAMTAAATAGSIVINGVATSSISTTTDAGVSRNAVVNAINSISNQTGVTAIDSGDDKNGVILKALDGRNVTVELPVAGTLTAASTGLAVGTTTGSFSLQSISGDPITLSVSATGDITRSGLSAGTYSPNASAMTTSARTASTAAPASFGAGTMKINGVAISGADPASDTASDTTATTSSTRSSSAIAIAAAINKSTDLTGVSAKVNANVVVGTAFTAAAINANTFTINGVSIDITSLTSTSWTRRDLADIVNRYTGQTGVVATDNGLGLTYTAKDGRNISMASSDATATNTVNLGLAASSAAIASGAGAAGAATTYATISLVSDKQFTVVSGSEGRAQFDLLGFKQGTFGGESNGFKVSQVDVSSQNGATAALKAIDAALDSVNFSQSRLGALQNRLDTVISNLTEVSRNTSESRSRIMDADYATETTNLAKSQIVQQAATAMLAQANQSAQSVLSLLK